MKIGKISQASVRIGDNAFDGIVNEVEVPALASEFGDDESLGLAGMGKFWASFGELEISFTNTAFNADFQAAASNHIDSQQLQIRANVMNYENNDFEEHVPLEITARIKFSETSAGNYTGKEHAEFEYKAVATAIRTDYNGRVILDVDYGSNRYVVDGVDLFEQVRANLGQSTSPALLGAGA